VQQLSKAMLVVSWTPLSMEFIEVQFNPTELTFAKAVQNAEVPIPGLDAPLLQFVRGQAETLTVDLFFDSTEDGTGTGAKSVTAETDKVYQLLKIVPERHVPPTVAFLWSQKFPGADVSSEIGNQRRTDFEGVIESIRQRFTLFSPEGVPLRAVLTVTFKEVRPLDQQLRQLNLSSPDRTHAHVLEDGDTLASVAARHLGSPAEWRHVAEANGIDDPRRLTAGTTLRVPPLD
jgi:nucleoid-associated protein YgaU